MSSPTVVALSATFDNALRSRSLSLLHHLPKTQSQPQPQSLVNLASISITAAKRSALTSFSSIAHDTPLCSIVTSAPTTAPKLLRPTVPASSPFSSVCSYSSSSSTSCIRRARQEHCLSSYQGQAYRHSRSPRHRPFSAACSRPQRFLLWRNPPTNLSSKRTQNSSSATWASVLLIVFLGGVYTFTPSASPSSNAIASQYRSRDNEEKYPASYSASSGSDELFDMAGGIPEGRPGNLTKEQEQKLQELWIATLKVFGVLEDPRATTSNGTTGANGSPAKPKKKRLTLFSRKNKDNDSEVDSSPGTPGTPTSGDPEDKYGQTQHFYETLANQPPALLRATFWSMVKHDNPDALLLRFLRARKWDVDKALVMMISTMSWRATDQHVDDDIMLNGEATMLENSQGSDKTKSTLGNDFLAQLRMGKSFTHGIDKMGRPMCVVRVRLHKQGDQIEEALERYTVYVIETTRLMMSPPVDTACVVFDMTGFSLANMDYTPVKFMIKVFEANYPESLGVVLIHKAPWVFQGIWKIVRGWLDPVVASKVNFTNSVEDIEQYVTKDRIMKELGGDEDWEYKYLEPVTGENDTMKDTATRDKLLAERQEVVDQYEKETLAWIRPSEGSDVEKVKSKRAELAESLRSGYWVLDPYIRARSYYDRIGLISPGGKIDYYTHLKKAGETPANGSAGTAPAAAAAGKPAEPVTTTADDDVD